MTPEQAAAAIRNSKGAWVGVTFIKRSTVELRELVCRWGPNKHLKGGAPAYDAASMGLLPVWDAHARKWKSIPIEGIRMLRINGKNEEVRA